MHYSHKTKHQVLSGVLALILSLSLLLPTIPTVWADEAADPRDGYRVRHRPARGRGRDHHPCH